MQITPDGRIFTCSRRRRDAAATRNAKRSGLGNMKAQCHDSLEITIHLMRLWLAQDLLRSTAVYRITMSSLTAGLRVLAADRASIRAKD
jgi:hypothetical protein